jgi:hypothetical protein
MLFRKKYITTPNRYSSIIAAVFILIVCICFISLSSLYLTLLIFCVLLICVIFFWPRIGLYAILLLSPYYFIWNNLLTSGQLGFVTRFSPIDLISVITLCAVLSRKLIKRNIEERFSATYILCSCWVLFSLFSLGIGIAEGYEAAFRAARGPLLFCLYFAAIAEIRSECRLRELRSVFLLNSCAIGLVGVIGAAGYLNTLFPNLAVGTIGVSFTRSNFFVEPALTIPNTVFLILMLRKAMPRPQGTFGLIIMSLFLNIATLMLSLTRGFMLGMSIALILTIIFLYKKMPHRFSGLFITISGTITIILIIEILFKKIQGVSLLDALIIRVQDAISSNDPQSIIYRIGEASAYFRSFLSSPIIGNGFGAPVLFSTDATIGFAHNEYLLVLQTTGLVGAGLLWTFLFLTVASLFRKISRSAKIGFLESYSILTLITIVSYAAVSMTSPEITNPTTTPLLAVLIGVVSNNSPRPSHSVSRP